jgi:hypothetical protein
LREPNAKHNTVDVGAEKADNRRMAMKSAGGVLVAALAVCGLAACGGGGKGATSSSATTVIISVSSSTTQSRQELAQQYLDIVRPGNAAVNDFIAKASHWNDQTSASQAAKDAAPLIVAIKKADGELLSVQWPAETRADVKELVKAHGALIGDLTALESVNILSAGDWVNQFTQDAGKANAAGRIVRADLGLPSANP